MASGAIVEIITSLLGVASYISPNLFFEGQDNTVSSCLRHQFHCYHICLCGTLFVSRGSSGIAYAIWLLNSPVNQRGYPSLTFQSRAFSPPGYPRTLHLRLPLHLTARLDKPLAPAWLEVPCIPLFVPSQRRSRNCWESVLEQWRTSDYNRVKSRPPSLGS